MRAANWLTSPSDGEFSTFVSLGSKASKAEMLQRIRFFALYSTVFRRIGIASSTASIGERSKQGWISFADAYNAEVDRYRRKGAPKDLDAFLVLLPRSNGVGI